MYYIIVLDGFLNVIGINKNRIYLLILSIEANQLLVVI